MLGVLVGALWLQACAHSPKTVSTEPSGPPAVEVKDSVKVSAGEAMGGAPEFSAIVRSDLTEYDKIQIDLDSAEVVVHGKFPHRKGSLSVSLVKENPKCKIHVSESEELLRISDSDDPNTSSSKFSEMLSTVATKGGGIPSHSPCVFSIDLEMPEASNLAIDLRRGSVALEQWDEPTVLRMGWGDIDVGRVADLSVECVRCNLTGEGVSGPLQFKMDRGNVGLAGLETTVTGQTLGDTVLKWRRIKSDAGVNLVSRAGDVILSFPKGVPLALELKAPRGEVYSKDMTMGLRGIPVSVSAEIGNVRLYRGSN